MFTTRAYNKIKCDPVFGTLTKTSKDSKLENEINYYLSIPSELSIFFPRVMGHGKHGNDYYITMEQYAYKTLGELITDELTDYFTWQTIVNKIKCILGVFAGYRTDIKGAPAYLRAMYIDKTEAEYNKLIPSFFPFNTICNYHELEINDKTYSNFYVIWDVIKKYIKTHLLDKRTFSIIHGDMCFSNILCGIDAKNNDVIIKLIDPRGSFGGDPGIYGDPLYDYAKLYHSFDGGYEYIIYDKFSLDIDDNYRSFRYSFINNKLALPRNIFSQVGYDINYKLIEGLIYIGMCARHYDSLNRQYIMYTTGVRLLNEFLTEIKS